MRDEIQFSFIKYIYFYKKKICQKIKFLCSGFFAFGNWELIFLHGSPSFRFGELLDADAACMYLGRSNTKQSSLQNEEKIILQRFMRVESSDPSNNTLVENLSPNPPKLLQNRFFIIMNNF